MSFANLGTVFRSRRMHGIQARGHAYLQLNLKLVDGTDICQPRGSRRLMNNENVGVGNDFETAVMS